MKTRRLALAMATLTLLSASPALAAADLVPVLTGVSDGSFGVRNEGDSASAPSQLTVVCEALAGPPSCPEAAGMAAYANPGFPNAATISVPALEPGDSFEHEPAFWPDLDFDPGTYEFSLMADAGNATAESDELNNAGQASKVVLHSVGVGGVGGGIGKLAARTAPPVVPPRAVGRAVGRTIPVQPATLVAGLPNLIATNIGFSLAGGVHRWGSTVTIDQASHVAQFGHGPRRDLCLLEQAAYRTFNASDYAAGAFKNGVYRGNTKVSVQSLDYGPREGGEWLIFQLPLKEGLNVIRVKIDDLGQVVESDEGNVYSLRVRVQLDCDGDGKIAGRPGGLKAKTLAPVAPKAERATVTVAPVKTLGTTVRRLRRSD